MNTQLFTGLTPQEVLDNLEAENCGVEDNYKYTKVFNDEDAIEVREQLSEAMVAKKRLEKKIRELTEPLREEIKPLTAQIKESLDDLDRGGEESFGKVYCFPDYESRLMGLYNEFGKLVGTRPLTRTERQLHINSFKPMTHGETIHSGTGS